MRTYVPRLLLVLVAALALLPLGRLAADWWAVAQLVGGDVPARPPRGFDWVQWEERDGEVTAAYLYPGGTADRAGLRRGARLYRLDGRQFFSVEDVRAAVEGVEPGRVIDYEVMHGDRPETVPVRITRYPTFLYPLGAALWQAALWGFALAAFVHGLALLVVAPVGGRARRAMRRLVLIAAASVWAFGTLTRLVALTLLGPPVSGAYAALFDALTYVSLAGWLAFPALLLRTVLLDRPSPMPRRWRAVLFVPPLALAAAVAAAAGGVGPLTLDALVGPILFYVGVYVAAAAGVVLATRPTEAADEAPWSRIGTAAVGALAAAGAFLVWGVGPRPDPTGAAGAWLVLGLQLLPLAPVVLVSAATLRRGRTDGVLVQALAYLAAVGVVFFAFVGGLTVLERLGAAERVSWPVLAALFAAGALVVGERLVRVVMARAAGWWSTERQRARQRLRAFGERARLAVDAERLGDEAIQAVGEALRPRSGALWLRAPGTDAGWRWSGFQPEHPRFSESDLERVWDALGRTNRVWARNPELDEARLPAAAHALLEARGVALAVPIAGAVEGEESAPAGLLVLAEKARRRAVYNVEDVAMLKNLAAQLALARDRLALLERERELVRETAQAELTALRAQINPHFLFNALNTIAALVAERPAEAEGVAERLAAIFRHTLQTGGDAFVRLADERRLVDDYLAIEQARFGDKLAVRRDWDPALDALEIPAFSVQTLVENAVKHGIERRRGGGEVALASRRVEAEGGAWAEIEVADTGVGIPALFGGEPADFFGIGLGNVAARLERLYGRPGLLALASSPDGTTARLRIPLDGARPGPLEDAPPG